ncbi:MAG: efflux RND transporter periplasmic adaptor subunit [Deltaproteobacteria bacterium]|nr:efflux RND transporter periplasmic adaptor subunit [Deltaproteobacteria bacterium]
MTKKVVLTGVLILILIGGAFAILGTRGNGPFYKTDRIVKGDIRTMVTATGTVNAVTTVLVGTQVSGTIKELYVDYNSPVRKGQLLARIDPATFEAQVEQARANVLAAKANVEKAKASALDAGRTLERNQELFARNFIARSDLDSAETGHSSALAAVSAAKAQVEQARAALKIAELNLRNTQILSPVSGTVISRSVDVGQTVAASFQTPTLFSIAQDLTKMQISTSVDEADIGRVRVGQAVEFTMDAYPDQIFEGKVSEVRNAPVTVQNVVTYDVIVRVDNPDLKLKPGMTANVSIVISEKKGILKIPNAALRFKPDVGNVGSQTARGPGVWILQNKRPMRVAVKTGISDGSFTELLEGELKEGREVIVAALDAQRKESASSRPPRFIP